MKGKNKCKILKQIRQKIADENDIPYVTRECSYRGECSGTCPQCEKELRDLEQELEKRRSLGKRVAVAAVATGLGLSLSACTPGAITSGAGGNELQGVVAPELESRAGEGDSSLLCPDDTDLPGRIELEGKLAVSTEEPEQTDPAEETVDPPELMGDVAVFHVPETEQDR